MGEPDHEDIGATTAVPLDEDLPDVDDRDVDDVAVPSVEQEASTLETQRAPGLLPVIFPYDPAEEGEREDLPAREREPAWQPDETASTDRRP